MNSIPLLALPLLALQQADRRALNPLPEVPRLFAAVDRMAPGTDGPFGDVDGDGDLDLVRGSRLHLNDGAGVFTRSRPLGTVSEPKLLFHADADGVLDLLTRDRFYRGGGAAGFVDASGDLPLGIHHDEGLAVDVDGDGDVDVLSIQHAAPGVPPAAGLHLNDGTGVFAEGPAALPGSPAQPRRARAGDVDGDGDLDLAVVGDDAVRLWRNAGASSFVAEGIGGLGAPTSALVLADVDGDGDLDVVANGVEGDRLLRNDGTGTFSDSPGLPPPSEPFLTELTGDFVPLDAEGDGDVDLLLVDNRLLSTTFSGCQNPAEVLLLVNDGGGTFTAMPPLAGGSLFRPISAALDVDGDGDADLVGGASVALNDGTGSFRLHPPPAPYEVTWSCSVTSVSSGTTHRGLERVIAVGDLDGDGLLDGLSMAGVLLNGPPGTLTPHPVPTPGIGFGVDCADGLGFLPLIDNDVALGDVDGDGDLDAYVMTPFDGCTGTPPFQHNALWVNDGQAVFADESDVRLPSEIAEVLGLARSVHLVDLDADGDLDGACLRRSDWDGQGSGRLYTNDGSGVFSVRTNLGRNEAGAFGDLDGDGDVDLLEDPEGLFQRLTLWTNDGAGNLVAAFQNISADPVSDQVLLGDLDGDGDLDACLPQASGPPLVLTNDGAASFTIAPGRVPDRLTAQGQLVDVDEDGDLDLASSQELLFNDGRGSFGPDRLGRLAPWDFDAYGDHPLVLADRDLDGDVDPWVAGVANVTRHVEALGPPRLGRPFTLVVHGPPAGSFTLLESRGEARVPLGAAGWLLVDPAQLVQVHTGTLGSQGRRRIVGDVPGDLALLGRTGYWQAFVGSPGRSTNVVRVTVEDL